MNQLKINWKFDDLNQQINITINDKVHIFNIKILDLINKKIEINNYINNDILKNNLLHKKILETINFLYNLPINFLKKDGLLILKNMEINQSNKKYFYKGKK